MLKHVLLVVTHSFAVCTLSAFALDADGESEWFSQEEAYGSTDSDQDDVDLEEMTDCHNSGSISPNREYLVSYPKLRRLLHNAVISGYRLLTSLRLSFGYEPLVKVHSPILAALEDLERVTASEAGLKPLQRRWRRIRVDFEVLAERFLDLHYELRQTYPGNAFVAFEASMDKVHRELKVDRCRQ